MQYLSTRGEAPELGFEDVLLAGLASDGGLYVPATWPRISPAQIASFATRPFADVAVDIISPFINNSVCAETLREMTKDAYASFGHPATTPVVQIDNNRFILELFHGPTLAFKDVAMQILARMMDDVLRRRGLRATIVGATSGDTGGAAIEAFRGRSRVDVFILYPAGRVSAIQRRMMTTPTDENIHALEIAGTFDDCQALVKSMFANQSFRNKVQLSGVNSINWARIVPQITYYFFAAARLGAPYRPVSFSVPTGNFGNLFAGYAAQQMGLGIDRLVVASNSNDILPRAIETGAYEKREVIATTSPSMDIQVSSNFERFLFEVQGRDGALIRRQMASLKQSGRFDTVVEAQQMRQKLSCHAASEDDVAACIRRIKSHTGYVLEPHTACGVLAAEQTLATNAAAEIVLATAHPAKFGEAMTQIIGTDVPLPDRFRDLLTEPERSTPLENNSSAVEKFIARRTRALA